MKTLLKLIACFLIVAFLFGAVACSKVDNTSSAKTEINSKEEDVISSLIEALLKNTKALTPDYDYMGLLRGNAELCNQIETHSLNAVQIP